MNKIKMIIKISIISFCIFMVALSPVFYISSSDDSSKNEPKLAKDYCLNDHDQTPTLTKPYIVDLNFKTDNPHHNITIFGETTNDFTGNSLASGDINNDGISDLIIGTRDWYASSEKVFVIFGKKVPSPIVDLKTSADIIFDGIDPQDMLGSNIEIGDVNGDNIDDIIMSANYGDGVNNAKPGCGEIYIVFGNESLPSSWRFSAKPPNVTIYGIDQNDICGNSISCGDINGDGIDDIIIGVAYGLGPNNQRATTGRGCGEVYVVFGNKSLSSIIKLKDSSNLTIYGAEGEDRAGWTVDTCNFNNDSFDDIIMGAYGGDGENNLKSNCGEVYIIYGNKSDVLPSTIDLLTTPANITINGTIFNENLGGIALTSGDINGDKIDDLLVSSRLAKIYVFHGNSSLPDNINISASNASSIISGNNYYADYFGEALAMGDINNDDHDDLLIGAYSADGPNDLRPESGEAYVINGSDSLPSELDLVTQSPNITIYGADPQVQGTDIGDNAGYAILLCDFNGDNIDDIIISAPGANGRNNNKENSGEVCILLSAGELLPLPFAGSVSLKNGAGDDNDICYAKYERYQFEIRIITPNNPDELEGVMLHLGYYYSSDNIKLGWSRSADEFSEINDPMDYISISPLSYSSEYKRIWAINFYVIFNWSYPNNNYQSIQVRTTGSTGSIDWLNLTNHIYMVENRLNLTGDLKVISETQGELTEGTWISGGEKLTWGGLKVKYEYTTEISIPPNTNLSVIIKDDDGNTWSTITKPDTEISIITYAVNNSRSDFYYKFSIGNIPPYCDLSEISFKLNIDADKVTFSNLLPKNNSWLATLRPTCGIRITDPSTEVERTSIQYRTSVHDGNSWNNWTYVGLQFVQDDIGINCTVKPIFQEGKSNLIQWRAKDIIGNDYAISPQNKMLIDISNVTFENPSPSSNDWQKDSKVYCGITIVDKLSGINASSIEFSTSSSGIWGYGDWQSVRETRNNKVINCSVDPIFTEGIDNYIRWRAKDLVGNGYRISDNYQIKVKINHPPTTTLITPLNNSLLNILTPELVWKGIDPDNDTELRYDVYLSNDLEQVISLNTTALIKSIENRTNYRLEAPLQDDNIYYWTIIPNDGFINGTCMSGYYRFKVKTSAELPKVTLIEPNDKSVITTTTPKLSWKLNYPNPELVTFNIYFSKSSDQNLISKENLYKKDYKLTTFIFDEALTPGENYYWTIIPIASEPEGILYGFCHSGIWNFKVELPEEKVYLIELTMETQKLRIEQGNYSNTNLSIINKGNLADTISISVDKGILDANIGIDRGSSPIWLNKSDAIKVKIEILVSVDAKPQNYTISITAMSLGGIAEGKDISEVSVTRTFTIEVLEKASEPDDNGDEKGEKGEEKAGGIDLMIWAILIIILILIVSLFIYVYLSRRIPYVKSELLTKPPAHLKLPGASAKPGTGTDLELPAAAGEDGVMTLEGTSIPITHWLPKAVLTKDEELKLLREKFLTGDITEETYRELKTEIESSKDITELEEVEPPEEEISEEEPPLDEDIEKELEEELLVQEPEVEEEVETRMVEEIEQELRGEIVEEEPGLEEEKISEPLITKKKPKLKKKKKAKRPKSKEKRDEGPIEEPVGEDELQDIPEEAYPFPDNGLCITCGQSLDTDMAYCWSCGTKYEMEK